MYQSSKWLDLLFKTSLSAEHKLVGTVIARTCVYNKPNQLLLSNISMYSISRILNINSQEVNILVTQLEQLGWLFDTGQRAGARYILALTFSLIPLGDLRQ